MGFSDDSDNDFSDWLDGFDTDADNQDQGEESASDAEGDRLDWLSEEPSGDAAASAGDEEEDDPEWLEGIREQEGRTADASFYLGGDAGDEDDDDAWLEGIRDQFEYGATHGLAEEGEPEGDEDFLETIRALKSADEEVEPVSDDELAADIPDAAPPEEISQEDIQPDTGGEESPDWVGGLPKMDLSEDNEETPKQEAPFTEDPNVTGSLPSWMENLQTTGLVMPSSSEEEEQVELEGAGYSEEEISTLFEQDDLPDWLGEDEEESPTPPAPEEVTPIEDTQPGGAIEQAELPSWLQAMKPVEAVTSVAEEEEVEDGAEAETTAKERVGPLSGLSGVIPAEPHIIHFGSPAKVAPGFELTDVQKQYTLLLKSMVEGEQANLPAKRRGVANPQQVLRWVIAVLLLVITFITLWIGDSFALALPDPANMPEENLAVISMVSELTEADRVLVAVEYQPALSGEVETAAHPLVKHLLQRNVQLVLVSTQPVGPGLGDTFLQENFGGDAYIASNEYTNLGYISGGAAGLLNLATDIRMSRKDLSWDQAPLDEIQSIRDFSMVLVLTDDPDIARSWVEQVQPQLAPAGGDRGVPLVMVVSAQAQPLVYPYYYTSPRQVSGLIGGVTGGAYYENVLGRGEAGRIWTAYNIGLVLAVLIIALGSMVNLARNSLQGTGKGRS